MSIYTRDVPFTAVSAVHTCIPLPCHMRAAFGHLYIKQTSGTLAGFEYTIYDRKGACPTAIDLFVLGGVLTSIGDNGSSKCRFTVTAADLVGLKVGDTVEVKGSDVSGYNVLTHVVTAIISTTQFDTDQAYTAPGTGGMWQTAPEICPTLDPDIHQVVDKVSVSGGTAFSSKEFNDLLYQNRDNQSPTARRLTSSLYLDIIPAGTGSKNFVISYTAQARHVTD